MRRGDFSAAITQLRPKKLWCRRKWLEGYKEIASLFTCCPANHEYSWKKNQIEKKKKKKYPLQHVRTDCRCMRMKSVLNLLWRRSILYRNQSSKSMDWFLYDNNLRHEGVNVLLLVCIHWDIFLDYDKIIDIYTSKYQKRMLLINPLSKN